MYDNNRNKSVFGTTAPNPRVGIGTNPAPPNEASFGRSSLFGSPSSEFGASPTFFTSTAAKPKCFFTNGGTTQQTGLAEGTSLFNLPSNTNGGGMNSFGFGQPSLSPGFGQQNIASGVGQQNPAFSYGFGTLPTSPLTQNRSLIKYTPTTVPELNCNIKLNSIVCMKEYQMRSQEEIRLEDYQNNRKGPHPSNGSNVTPTFGNALRQPEHTPKFPQFDNKPTFGPQIKINTSFGQAQNNLFGQTAPGLTNQPKEQTPIGSIGLTTNKPFSLPTFVGTPTVKPFAFNSATFREQKQFGSPPVQPQYSFNTSTPVTTVSQPIPFGGSSFGQTNAPTNNTNMLSKPAPPFNFQQVGQTSSPINLFQAPKPSTGFANFGNPSTPRLATFGTASSNLQQPGSKIQPNFNFEPQSNVLQPPQSPFVAVQNPGQLNLRQSGFGTEIPGMTNNFVHLHTPMAPSYNFTEPQQNQQVLRSPFDESEDFRNIVDKIYEMFPYRSEFDGISVKPCSTHNVTNPRMLNKIMEEDSLPYTPINTKANLRLLTGPQKAPENRLKYKWLDLDHTPDSGKMNNFVLVNKSGKRLTLKKAQLNNDKSKDKPFPDLTDGAFQNSILKRNVGEPKTNLFVRDNNSNVNEGEKLERTIKDEELTSLLAKHFFAEFRTNTGIKKEDRTIDFPRKLLENERTMGTQTSPKSTPSPITRSPRKKQLDPISEEESLPTEEEHMKIGFKPKLVINRLQNRKSPNKGEEPVHVGDSPEILDTCGIKQTREDYYTFPPLEEIRNNRNLKGECFVKGFTIGRHGFGKIHFPNKIDISNLNLDEIIHFRLHEVIVYPDDEKKPKVGEGLNQPGQITLESVWPRHSITREILKNPNEMEKENFVQRLILLNQKQNAVFVDYYPDTGSWVFQVEHFSKFSFTESEDEAIVKELTAKKKEKEKELKEQALEEAKRKGLGGNAKEEKDEGSFQKNPPRDSLSQEKLKSLIKERFSNVSMLKYSLFDGLPKDDLGPSPDVSVSTNRNRFQKRPITCKPKISKLLNLTWIVPKEKSLIISTKNCLAGGLFKEKSFKIGWGPRCTFLTGGGCGFELNPGSSNEECKENVVKYWKIGDLSMNPRMVYLKEHLEAVYDHSTVMENSKMPTSVINDGHHSLIAHQDISKSLDDTLGVTSSLYSQVWNLCLALWGPEALISANRRELFSKWLEDVTLPFVKTEPRQSAIKNIFIYLTGHKITEAAELADEENFSNLSLLITQSSAQESSKQLVCDQLEQWKSTGVLHLMDKDFVKIYMLLGGIPFLSGINVCENLDWTCCLGVYFWYICPTGISLINALQAFQNAFMSGLANPPTPEGYEFSCGKVYGVLYQIMMLFVTPTMPLEKVLNPITYTSDPLDYRLSWILLQALTALKVGTISTRVTNSIHVNFATQLEHLQLWKWSVFVLSFIQDESCKTNAILTILEKNLDPDRTSLSLVNKFKVPSEWFHSILSNLVGNDLEMYLHLISAKNWCKAHEVAMEKIIPDFIIKGELQNLSELLEDLIPDFLEFRKIIHDNESFTETELWLLKQKLLDICLRVKDFPINFLKQTVAATELSKSLLHFLRIFYCELEPINVKNIPGIFGLIKDFPMPPDCKLKILGTVCTIFFKNSF